MALFNEAADLPAGERAAYLEAQCADDPALHQEVESLLAALNRHAGEVRRVLGGLPLAGPADRASDEALPPAPDRLVGRTVAHYKILDRLGGGGMGVVYRALDEKLERAVALKFLPPHLGVDEAAKARFIHEAKAASALDHANIGTIYEIGETDEGQLFIAMAYYAGETIKQKIARGPLAVEEALDYAVQISEGLSRAHAAGIVHRDVKPANVMVTERGQVKLVDFGLAKVQDVSLTATGMTLGTVAYMSPEQASGEAVDHRTDLWSLGVVLYEMLTGTRPFRGDYPQAVIYAILNEEPKSVKALREDVPAALERIVEQLLRKNPDERYQHVEETLADLQAAGQGREAVSDHLRQRAEGRAAPLLPSEDPGGDRARAGPVYPAALPPAEAQDRSNLLILLQRVRQFWIEGVLEQSVHGEALLDLGKATHPEAVVHPWEQILELPDRSRRTLPPGKPLDEVFDEGGRSLLILGAPGAGKTITLLDLARALITRAEQDPTQPVPVVFNLSSWTDPRRALFDWLAEELSTKYQVPKRMGRAWLEQNRLALLLDGLDEVRAEHRAACVEAINAYIEAHGVPGLAVCSRLEDYTALPVRLRLYAAVCLQPLEPEQVKAYVARSGEALAGLAAALQQDQVLQSLAQTPLMLDVMSLAYRDVPAEALASEALATEQARRSHLFETYIGRMFTRRGKAARPYAKEQTLGWLTWLAQQMQRHGQTAFLIEQVQPSWLATRGQRWAYMLSSRLAGGLLIGLIFGFIQGLNYGLDFALDHGLILGPIGGLIFGLVASLLDLSRFERSRLWKNVNEMPRRRQVAVYVVAAVLLTMLLGGFIGGVSYGRTGGLIVALNYGLVFGLIGGLIWGTRATRRSLTSDIQTVESLSWSWIHARESGRRGIPAALIVGLASGIGYTLAVEPIFGLTVGPVFGMTVLLAYALFGGLRNGLVERKTIPNQGIRLSVRNALLGGGRIALIVALIVGLIAGLIFVLSKGVTVVRMEGWVWVDDLLVKMRGKPIGGLIFGGITGLYNGLIAWLVVGFWYGGLDVIQHYTLRFILYCNGYAPRHYARFLDEATRLIFLRKVGGGYIFIHRLLLEHFAKKSTRDGQAEPVAQTRQRLRLVAGLAIFILLLIGLGIYLWRQTSGPKAASTLSSAETQPDASLPSLAVLPLKNYSGDADQEYFADGMTEELITTLTKIEALRVIAHRSVLQFKHSDHSVPEIARLLGVQYVVDGSVLQDGDRVRITASVIDAATNTPVWGERFERELRDVMALQRAVALAIAREVAATLTPQEQTHLAEAPVVNAAAFDHYLWGRHYRSHTSGRCSS